MVTGREQAIVIGGSMAGMLAARVLSDSFERVVMLDRDDGAQGPVARTGVPHGKHLHVLLGGGQQVLETLLPGFQRDLDQAGSIALRVGYDTMTVENGRPWPRRDLGFTNNAQTRPLLEHVLRTRLRANPRIETRWDCRVLALLVDETKQCVRGVRYRDERTSQELEADLVIDASGRQARALEWLDELGYARPEETRIDVDMSYATAVFATPAHPRLDALGLGIVSLPPDKRGGGIQAIEGGRWIATLVGRLGDHPPADLAGYREYARKLHTPMLYDAISELEPLAPIERFRFPASVRRRYERLEAFPERFLPIGDAMCSFNPIYGQGMTTAAKEAEALGQLLAEVAAGARPLDGLWRAFFPIAAEIITTPWIQAGSADLAYPETVGTRPANFELGQQFSSALVKLAMEDAGVHKLLMQVMQLMAPRDAFRDPALIERVMQMVQR